MADSFTANILGVSDLVESDTNKIRGEGGLRPEGKVGDEIDVLDLPMSDEKLLKLRDDWESQYALYEGKVAKPTRDRNLQSYLGRNAQGMLPSSDEIVAANLQFESEETFLPAATAQDPTPFVFCDNTPEGNKLADDCQTMLQFHAQQLLIRRKIALMVRQWSINHLAALKMGWERFEVDGKEFGDVAVENRKIQDFIFDPNGYVDVHGHFTSWMGERIYSTAEELADLFPKFSPEIILTVDGRMGTEVCRTEWWNDEYSFTTFSVGGSKSGVVLDKHKNEFFNYNKKQKPNPLTGQVEPPKRNHFSTPRKPYVFLSVFSLQERPHDITGLIEQNIANQRKINKRVEQIDNNVSQANNGLLFSEKNFNQETGKQAYDALTTKGHGGVLVPEGTNPNGAEGAIVRLDAPNFPESGFKDLENSENHLRSSWGTQGIASQQAKPDETARGMTLNQQRDTSRIGGGIVDVIEQTVAKGVFDWLIQLYCVFYDEPHFGAVMGTNEATNYVTLSSQIMTRQLIVGVAPNSMQPKDPISEGNQAMSLFHEKAIGPKVLLDTLKFPNADEAAGDGVLWAIDPQAYLAMNFPELAQKLQQMQQQAQQAQLQQQQQQAQLEAQSGQQQLQQKGQAGAQQLQQGEASHQQKLRQEQESHAQKLQLSKEAASAALHAKTAGTQPK